MVSWSISELIAKMHDHGMVGTASFVWERLGRWHIRESLTVGDLPEMGPNPDGERGRGLPGEEGAGLEACMSRWHPWQHDGRLQFRKL